jgi:hypothetical protein
LCPHVCAHCGAPQVLLRLGLLPTPGAAKLKQPTETLRLDDRADLMASPPRTLFFI